VSGNIITKNTKELVRGLYLQNCNEANVYNNYIKGANYGIENIRTKYDKTLGYREVIIRNDKYYSNDNVVTIPTGESVTPVGVLTENTNYKVLSYNDGGTTKYCWYGNYPVAASNIVMSDNVFDECQFNDIYNNVTLKVDDDNAESHHNLYIDDNTFMGNPEYGHIGWKKATSAGNTTLDINPDVVVNDQIEKLECKKINANNLMMYDGTHKYKLEVEEIEADRYQLKCTEMKSTDAPTDDSIDDNIDNGDGSYTEGTEGHD
jgi:hypothetical protein